MVTHAMQCKSFHNYATLGHTHCECKFILPGAGEEALKLSRTSSSVFDLCIYIYIYMYIDTVTPAIADRSEVFPNRAVSCCKIFYFFFFSLSLFFFIFSIFPFFHFFFIFCVVFFFIFTFFSFFIFSQFYNFLSFFTFFLHFHIFSFFRLSSFCWESNLSLTQSVS